MKDGFNPPPRLYPPCKQDRIGGSRQPFFLSMVGHRFIVWETMSYVKQGPPKHVSGERVRGLSAENLELYQISGFMRG